MVLGLHTIQHTLQPGDIIHYTVEGDDHYLLSDELVIALHNTSEIFFYILMHSVHNLPYRAVTVPLTIPPSQAHELGLENPNHIASGFFHNHQEELRADLESHRSGIHDSYAWMDQRIEQSVVLGFDSTNKHEDCARKVQKYMKVSERFQAESNKAFEELEKAMNRLVNEMAEHESISYLGALYTHACSMPFPTWTGHTKTFPLHEKGKLNAHQNLQFETSWEKLALRRWQIFAPNISGCRIPRVNRTEPMVLPDEKKPRLACQKLTNAPPNTPPGFQQIKDQKKVADPFSLAEPGNGHKSAIATTTFDVIRDHLNKLDAGIVEEDDDFDPSDNIILEGGKLKIKENEIRALDELSVTVDTWIDASTRAKTVIKEELDMGDGPNGRVTLFISDQYIKYFDYWLNFNGLRKFFPVLQKFNHT
ncbi:hypothetical protein IW261DRAFT_1426608 [Armillaria novae-zelandiae]|uniref:Uncharacterized protein n=1 Tax=Armillaria novae-zelandiae TaxID=153914 RepID=A0AA39NKS8_9AGAR|nr:hypothetical protein IW261DRAFT_1426608 [Armillaria novae-zelandiae]